MDPIGESVMKLFWSRGYAATSMGEVVSTLGASRATTYRVHGSKVTLLNRALDHYARDVTSSFQDRLTRGDGLEAIRGFTRLRRELRLDETRPAGCLVMRLVSELSGEAGDADELAPVRERLDNAIDGLRLSIRAALEDAERLGQIHPGRDLDAASRSIMAIITGLVMTPGPVLSEAELDRLVLAACDAKAQGQD